MKWVKSLKHQLSDHAVHLTPRPLTRFNICMLLLPCAHAAAGGGDAGIAAGRCGRDECHVNMCSLEVWTEMGMHSRDADVLRV